MLRGAAVGILLVALMHSIPGGPAPFEAVSETEGEILLAYIQYRRSAGDVVAPAYRALFHAMDSARIVVGCPSQEDWDDFRARVGDKCNPARFHPLVAGRPISTWAKDRFIAVRSGDRWRLLVPHRPPDAAAGADDWLVAWDLSKMLGAEVRVLPIEFDAGDLWVTGGRAFLHRDLVRKNAGTRPDEILRMLRSELGVEPVVIDGPPHHLGMFAAPLHDGRALAGPADAAASLRLVGLRVVSLPFDASGLDRAYLTYTNVLVSGRRVFMPVFGVDTDDAAERVWREEGFEVVRIPCRDLRPLGGTIHCLVSVLRRGG